MVNSKNEYIKMDSVEANHWWYKSLHKLVLNTIIKEFDKKDISILDAGCGTGGLLSYLKSYNYSSLNGFDISDSAIEIAKAKELNVYIQDLKEYKFNKQKYDVIISNDTMYFFDIDEQKAILNEFYKSLNNGGIVILNLPSFEIFKGIHDKAVGIKKRFDSKMVQEMLENSKYEIIQKRYWPFLLSPIVFITRVIQRVKMKFDKDIKIESDIDMPPNFINNSLYSIVDLENHLFNSKPFGSSMFLVLKKIN